MSTASTLSRFRCACAALAAAALLLHAGCAGLPPGGATPRQAEVNGARLAYVEQGRGAPLVLVHGSIADHRSWDRQRELLARDFHVVAYSQRYFGPQPWQAGWPKIGVPSQSEDLTAFLRGLGAGPVHLVGWSSGGTVVLNVALQHPELVKSAFVYEPPLASAVPEGAERQAVSDDRAAAFGPAVDALKRGDQGQALGLVLDAVDGRAGTLERWPPAVSAVARDNARTLPLEFFDSDSTPPITCAQLGRLQPPVAVARGELTRVSYRLMADAVAACVPGSRRVVVPRARHLWPADEPQAFSEAVRSFVKAQ
jgi:pimeloyl-ACP methyl ester carboxylesterase